jgi:hypothetical protein
MVSLWNQTGQKQPIWSNNRWSGVSKHDTRATLRWACISRHTRKLISSYSSRGTQQNSGDLLGEDVADRTTRNIAVRWWKVCRQTAPENDLQLLLMTLWNLHRSWKRKRRKTKTSWVYPRCRDHMWSCSGYTKPILDFHGQASSATYGPVFFTNRSGGPSVTSKTPMIHSSDMLCIRMEQNTNLLLHM